MIPRYTHPEMGRIWSDQRRYETWLLVETAAAEAMAAAGIVPADAARDIRDRGAFDIARIDEIEQAIQHDVIAFTTAVAEKVGPSARWLHFGMTSSDVIDTAQALQMRDACDLILKDLDALSEAVRARDSRAAEDGDRGSRGAVRERPEGLVGDAAQTQPDRVRADRRHGAPVARQRARSARERRAVARARHLAFVGRARDSARQLH